MSAWKRWARTGLATWLKVPPEPQAPAGTPGTVRTFRAAENYFRIKQLTWLVKQLALVGFAIAFAVGLHQAWSNGTIHLPDGRSFQDPTSRWIAGGILALHLLPLAVELISMPFTYALAWLDYDLRWYITTDRSLRIREGIWKVREITLTFANIQQMTIRQGPVQRLFGIADLVVTTAGGGGSPGPQAGQAHAEPVHTGTLRGVSNADEIRDWIQEKSRALKDSGLGDPDDAAQTPGALEEGRGAVGLGGHERGCVLEAARELQAEAEALRRQIGRKVGIEGDRGTWGAGRGWQKM